MVSVDRIGERRVAVVEPSVLLPHGDTPCRGATMPGEAGRARLGRADGTI